MIDDDLHLGRKRSAREAGALYAVLATAMFPHMLRSRIFIAGDPVRTASNVLASETLLRLSVFGDIICEVAFLILGLSLYRLLGDARKRVARAMVAFVVVAVSIALLNCASELVALTLFKGGDYAQAMAWLECFNDGELIAGVFFGLWLFPFGMLVYSSGFMPKSLGIILMAGCFGYLGNSFIGLVLPSLVSMAAPAVALSAIAEFAALFWLLAFGARRPAAASEA